ncbi:MAG: choice-of-anchor D domain-containing protein [Agarilytica sp.]
MHKVFIVALICFLSTSYSYAETVFFDDFSNGNLSDWNASGSGTSSVQNGKARLSRKRHITQAVATTGWENVVFSVDHSSQGHESNDSCLSQISTDGGSSYVTVADTSDAFQATASPSGIDDNNDVVLRMRSASNSRFDYCFFDNITLTGDAVTTVPGPEITVTGNGDFGAVEIGSSSESTITILNEGDANLSVGDVSGLALPFDISADNCSNTILVANQSCSLIVTYSPTGEFTSSDTLDIPSNDASEPLSSVGVTGSGFNVNNSGAIFSDDFESGYSSWTIGGSGDFGVVSKAGSQTLNLAKTSSASVTVNTGGNTDVVITLDMIASSLENGELCIAEAQGSAGWVTVGMLENGDDNGSVFTQAASNGSFDDTSLTLRLSASGNINSDDCYFDNINIESIPGGVPREEASFSYLMGVDDQTFSSAAFAQTNSNATTNSFEGSLMISGSPVFSKNYGTTGDLPSGYAVWPSFNYEFVQDGNRLIPIDRGHSFIGSGAWSVSAGVGAAWDEAGDNGYTRAAFPYTIKQNNTNCEHNGLATFLFKDDGSVSNVHVQNVAETCIFYGFEFYGTLLGEYDNYPISSKSQVISERDIEERARIPTKPLSDLAVDFPGVDLSNYGYAIDAQDLNGYSILVNGISYMDGCTTRYGTHPYCADKTVGIYSFTKSIHAFMVVAALEKRYPGFKNQLISNLVPECAGDARWNGVTVENALDMATGNYTSANYEVDEGSSAIVSNFFNQTTRTARAAFACTGWPNKTAPGTYHVYHTTDTELVGYAASAFVKSQLGASAEAFDDILVPIYNKIGLSNYIRGIQRTSDSQDAWGGYGLSTTLNDVVRIAQYLRDEAVTDDELDATMVSEVISGGSQGLYAQLNNFNYDNGFWRYHVGAASDMSACGSGTQVPVMSGYGGHTSIILPEVIITQLTDGGGIGFLNTIDDVFNHVSNACPSN